MPNSPGRFRAAVSVGWVLLGLAAWVYARMKGIPAWSALPVAAAFLAEFPFYLLPAFDAGRLRTPWLLAATCVAPYLIYSVPTGAFRWQAFLLLTAIVIAVSFWYRLLRANALTDACFLILIAAVMLSKVFNGIYLSPIPVLHRSELATLGHLMLIRSAAIAILAIRRGVSVQYRFVPNRREWLVGLKWFAVVAPASGLALWALGILKPRPHPYNALLALGEFLGILWVVSMPEEFFFRGLLQQWTEQWTGSVLFALLATSVVFGAAHLAFHGMFPNWRFAIVAAIFGLCCALAWRESRSIQASMVTHALAATLYQVFFV